jgi:hypothetical protein
MLILLSENLFFLLEALCSEWIRFTGLETMAKVRRFFLNHEILVFLRNSCFFHKIDFLCFYEILAFYEIIFFLYEIIFLI